MSRSDIEKEVVEDLSKTDQQLLTDVHEEILRNDRGVNENIAHAYKRLASLFAISAIASREVAEQSHKLQGRVEKLTKYIFFLLSFWWY